MAKGLEALRKVEVGIAMEAVETLEEDGPKPAAQDRNG